MADATSDSKVSREIDRVRVIQIDAEIQALEEKIRLLSMERLPHQQRLDALRYPVLTLPNEIVSEIFVQFLPPYPLCPPHAGLFSPTTLTQICRKWRWIAETTPRLWRAISLPRPSMRGHADGEQVHALESWVRRSARCPLSIQMSSGPLLAWQWSRNIGGLLLHRDRWEHLELDFLGHSYRSLDLAKLIGAPMPLLRTLSLKAPQDITADPVVFRDVPLLRSVTANNLTCPADFLPWAQLTSLTLCRATTFLRILSETVNLRELELIVPCAGVRLDDIKLPHLETLLVAHSYYHIPSDPVTRYLDALTLPKLHTLQIPEVFLGAEPIEALTSFISKSGCKLQKVVILENGSLSEESYREAFPMISVFSCFDYIDEKSHSDLGSW
ncbi:hypothetical protein FB45DRAFT_27437 [Roridomyces roridus]|uniref:F-box domain-containing protein n=1 Tax=Roridomyces roridus TaxID=1738132 RepID=A0AAD7CK65_9AGAR|nr:hypothetical protein FB45DRAFT_27437 [Roridomyces roridus]